jgi:hypothetical protein
MKTETSMMKSWNEIARSFARNWRPSMSNSNTECMPAADCSVGWQSSW